MHSRIFLHQIVQNKPVATFTSYKYPICSVTVSRKKRESRTRKGNKNISSNPANISSLKKKMAMLPSFFNNRRGSSILDPFSAFDIWDPLKDFPFTSSNSLIPRENSAFVSTRIDWKETPEAHVLKADLPGLKKEEVRVEIEDDRVLQISGERSVEKEDKNDTWHHVERSGGRFLRRFRLPANAKMDQMKASMENGVLTVTVPKEEVHKPQVKAIEISG